MVETAPIQGAKTKYETCQNLLPGEVNLRCVHRDSYAISMVVW